MSAERSPARLTCPTCGSTLITDGLKSNALMLCAGCQSVVGGVDRAAARTSRRAIASLVLGCASAVGLFVTGIPAVLLGVSALRAIRREPDALKGTALAIAGITTGVLFGLICGTCTIASVAIALTAGRGTTTTEDPRQVTLIAARIGQFEVPRGLKPLQAIEIRMLDTRSVFYGNSPGAAHPAVVISQNMKGMTRAQFEPQVRQQAQFTRGRNVNFEVERTEQLTFIMRGQPVTVGKSMCVDRRSGERIREYSAEVPDPEHLTLVVLVTPDESGDLIDPVPATLVNQAPTPGEPGPKAATVALTEEEVRRFFESFK